MPFGNMDELEASFKRVMDGIIAEWGTVDLLNDRQTKALIDAIVATMQAYGMDVAESLPNIISQEYAAGSDEAIGDLADLSMSGINEDFTRQIHVAAVQELLLDTGRDLQAAIRTGMISGTTDVMGIVNNVTNILGDSLVKGQARKKAQKEVMKEFAEHGLTSFITSDGKRLPLDFYAQTVTRTKRKAANVQGQINRYKENGVEYVKILPHAPSCHICAAHFGVIIQISGEPQGGIPHISNTKLPPFHPNCKCSMVPITSLQGEDIIQPATGDSRTEAQRRAYEAEQRIRRKANAERKLYEKMKAEGVEVPSTIGAFRRQRRKNDEGWKALQAEYRSVIQTNAAQTSTQFRSNPPRRMADREFIEQWRRDRDTPKAWKPENTKLFQEQQIELYKGNKISDLKKNGLTDAQWDEWEESRFLKPEYVGTWSEQGIKKIFGDDMTLEGVLHSYNPDPSRFKARFSRFNINSNEQYSEAKIGIGLEDMNGKHVATIDRNIIYMDKKDAFYVKNELLEVDKTYQGQDLATNIYFKSEQLYKEMAGGKPINISTLANLSVGVYAWTRHGFDFQDKDDIESYHHSLTRMINDRLADRMRAGEFGTQTKDTWKEEKPKRFKEALQAMGYNDVEEIQHTWQMAALDDGYSWELVGLGSDIKGVGHFGKYLMLSQNSWKGMKRLNQDKESETVGNLYYQRKGIQ